MKILLFVSTCKFLLVEPKLYIVFTDLKHTCDCVLLVAALSQNAPTTAAYVDDVFAEWTIIALG